MILKECTIIQCIIKTDMDSKLKRELMNGRRVHLLKDNTKCTLTWSISCRDNVQITVWGQISGKLQQSQKVIEGKNIGRANETTPKEQNIKEAISLIKKKLDNLYKFKDTIVEESEDVLTDDDSEEPVEVPNKSKFEDFRPMLAQSLSDQKKEVDLKQCYSSVKLDGMRLLAYMENGEIVFKSRNGKTNTQVDYLTESVKELINGNENIVVDGELYKHKMNFQRIIASCKKENSTKLNYHVYDIYDASNPDASFEDRFVKRFEGVDKIGKHIKIVDVAKVDTHEELANYHDEVVKSGYEGVMVRLLNSPYQPGKRSKFLLKCKAFLDLEAPVVNFLEGQGRDAKSVIFECQLDNGLLTKVRPAWPLTRRQECWRECCEDFSKYKGLPLTIRYFEKTKDGNLRFPVGVEFRTYE